MAYSHCESGELWVGGTWGNTRGQLPSHQTPPVVTAPGLFQISHQDPVGISSAEDKSMALQVFPAIETETGIGRDRDRDTEIERDRE